MGLSAPTIRHYIDIMEPTYIVIPSDENYPLREDVEVIGLPKLLERLGRL